MLRVRSTRHALFSMRFNSLFEFNLLISAGVGIRVQALFQLSDCKIKENMNTHRILTGACIEKLKRCDYVRVPHSIAGLTLIFVGICSVCIVV